MENHDDNAFNGLDRRSESRSIVEYLSVEFSVRNLAFVYQFKIWETSTSGMSILIKEDSAVLEHLNVGDVLDMKYYPVKSSDEPQSFKTEIKHITKDEENRFKELYLVGLTIIETK